MLLKLGTGNGEPVYSGNPPDNSEWGTKGGQRKKDSKRNYLGKCEEMLGL